MTHHDQPCVGQGHLSPLGAEITIDAIRIYLMINFESKLASKKPVFRPLLKEFGYEDRLQCLYNPNPIPIIPRFSPRPRRRR